MYFGDTDFFNIFHPVHSEEFEEDDISDNVDSHAHHQKMIMMLNLAFHLIILTLRLIMTILIHRKHFKNLVKSLLKIKHKNSLSAKTMLSIGCCTSELISSTVARLRKGLEKCLDSANVDMDEIEGMQDVFAESDDLCKATKTFSYMNVERNWKQGFPMW